MASFFRSDVLLLLAAIVCTVASLPLASENADAETDADTNVNADAEADTIASAVAVGKRISADKVEKVNRFVDKMLAAKGAQLKAAIGTIKLPDEHFDFSKSVLGIDTHGFAKLTHGHLDNLNAIVRKGDCALVALNNVLQLVVDLGADDVRGGYDIEVEFGIFGATSNLKIQIESVEFILTAVQSFRPLREKADDQENILNFDLALNVLVNLGPIDVDVNIFSPLDWLLNLIAEKVVRNLKGRLQQMLKAPIRNAIEGINGAFLL